MGYANRIGYLRKALRVSFEKAIVPGAVVTRHLAKANLKSKRPFRALPLTPEYRQLRLQCCQADQCGMLDWQKVVFSEESRFVLGTDDNRVRVWRHPDERVLLFISGETQSSLSYQFRIAQNTIYGIIPAVCAAICHHLGSEIRVPESGNEWKMVTEEFWANWNFPLCLGAMHGKHIRIKPPSHSGATYRNYKGFFSIVLLALVYGFLYGHNRRLLFSTFHLLTNYVHHMRH
ncbi:DDE Tnp4 domain-containing protein [Trichonephila clavipes]|nr:DDE Tnp4 domain-containing protein [Trichonephila clavipes]